MKKTVAVFLCCLLLVGFIGCGSNKDVFAGEWKYSKVEREETDDIWGDLASSLINAFDFDVTMTFDGNGNGVNQAAAMEAKKFTYTFDEKTLTLVYDGVTQVFEYEINGNEMRLTSDGSTIIYEKQK